MGFSEIVEFKVTVSKDGNKLNSEELSSFIGMVDKDKKVSFFEDADLISKEYLDAYTEGVQLGSYVQPDFLIRSFAKLSKGYPEYTFSIYIGNDYSVNTRWDIIDQKVSNYKIEEFGYNPNENYDAEDEEEEEYEEEDDTWFADEEEIKDLVEF